MVLLCLLLLVCAFRSVSDAGWAFVLGRSGLDSSAGRRCAGPAVVIILVLSEAKNYRKVRSVSVGEFCLITNHCDQIQQPLQMFPEEIQQFLFIWASSPGILWFEVSHLCYLFL